MLQPLMPNSGLYVTPPQSAYHLGKTFYLPAANGPMWAIAFDARTSQYITSSITVTLTLMFSWIWGLLAAAAVYWAPHGFPRRRLVALILLRNTTDPRSALLAFLGYTTESMGWFRIKKPKRKEKPATWRDTFFGTVFLLLALIIVLLNVVMGIIIPPFLVVGNAAPVNEAELFSPNTADVRPEVFRAFLSSGSLRSLSSVEIFGEQVRKAVTINDDPTVITVNNAQPMYGLTYEYHVTGVDFGLQRASELTLSVTGSCRTEYGWYNTSRSTDTIDAYDLFGNFNWRHGFLINQTTQPVRTSFLDVSTRAEDDAKGIKEQAMAGKVQYAILPGLAHKFSSSENQQDPWYLTEQTDPPAAYPTFTHRIRAQRPALLCEHRDTWTVPGRDPVHGILNLEPKDDITGQALPHVLWNVMRQALWRPVVQRVGTDATLVALASVISAQGSEFGLLNAGASSIRRDMERLIQAGYINTINALAQSSAHQLTPTPPKGSNAFYDDEGRLLPGSSDFVVRTPDVLTFNLIGLITTGALILLLLILKLALHLKLTFYVDADPILGEHDRDPNQEIPVSPVELNKDRWARFSAFSAIHLLRNAYEDGTGHPEDDWQCCEDLPDPTEEKKLQLVRCKGGNYGCAGHLATDLPGSRRRASTMTSLSAMNLSGGAKTPSVATPYKSEPRYSGFSQTAGAGTYFPRATPPLSAPSPVSEPAVSDGGRYPVQDYGPQQWQGGHGGGDLGGHRGPQYRDEEPAIHTSPLLSGQGTGWYPPRY